MTNIGTETGSTMQERGVFVYGEQIIHYDVIRKLAESSPHHAEIHGKKPAKAPRKVVIKVHPDQRVVATAPHDATADAIQHAMLKRARWIWQSIEGFASQVDAVLPRVYVSGETQFYLGRRYVLKVITQSDTLATVKLRRGRLEVTLDHARATSPKQVKALIDQWYVQHAKHIFHERLQILLSKATWVEGIPSFRMMAMKKQWGSCSTKGNLMLNPHLVKASKACIDYVILHELCHMAEHNHSEKFWRLLTQVMPNWKEVKATLDDMAELYLNA